MGKPIDVVYFTAAGEVHQSWTEEQIEAMPSIRGVVKPTEGRPRLAAALLFQLQNELETADELFTIVDQERNVPGHSERMPCTESG